MQSLMCNWFEDWGRVIKDGLGQFWLIVLIVVFASISLLFLSNILRASVNKSKIVIKWGQLILLAIFLFFTIWFLTLA